MYQMLKPDTLALESFLLVIGHISYLWERVASKFCDDISGRCGCNRACNCGGTQWLAIELALVFVL